MRAEAVPSNDPDTTEAFAAAVVVSFGAFRTEAAGRCAAARGPGASS